MTPVRAVIFDFGGVLCFHPLEEYIARAAQTCEIPMTEFQRAFWSHRGPYDAGETGPDEYWDAVARAAGKSLPAGVVPKMVEHEITFWSRYDDRVLAWSRTLRAQGLRIGILSNLPIPLGKHLRTKPEFMGHFDHVTFSYELLLTKPDRAIYEHAIQGLGIQPGEALFLDDRAENVEGAIAAGLRAALYSTWEDFVADGIAERYGLPAPAEARRQ
jgi:putative hydrolase of the HAD superfamily